MQTPQPNPVLSQATHEAKPTCSYVILYLSKYQVREETRRQQVPLDELLPVPFPQYHTAGNQAFEIRACVGLASPRLTADFPINLHGTVGEPTFTSRSSLFLQLLSLGGHSGSCCLLPPSLANGNYTPTRMRTTTKICCQPQL